MRCSYAGDNTLHTFDFTNENIKSESLDSSTVEEKLQGSQPE